MTVPWKDIFSSFKNGKAIILGSSLIKSTAETGAIVSYVPPEKVGLVSKLFFKLPYMTLLYSKTPAPILKCLQFMGIGASFTGFANVITWVSLGTSFFKFGMFILPKVPAAAQIAMSWGSGISMFARGVAGIEGASKAVEKAGAVKNLGESISAVKQAVANGGEGLGQAVANGVDALNKVSAGQVTDGIVSSVQGVAVAGAAKVLGQVPAAAGKVPEVVLKPEIVAWYSPVVDGFWWAMTPFIGAYNLMAAHPYITGGVVISFVVIVGTLYTVPLIIGMKMHAASLAAAGQAAGQDHTSLYYFLKAAGNVTAATGAAMFGYFKFSAQPSDTKDWLDNHKAKYEDNLIAQRESAKMMTEDLNITDAVLDRAVKKANDFDLLAFAAEHPRIVSSPVLKTNPKSILDSDYSDELSTSSEAESSEYETFAELKGKDKVITALPPNMTMTKEQFYRDITDQLALPNFRLDAIENRAILKNLIDNEVAIPEGVTEHNLRVLIACDLMKQKECAHLISRLPKDEFGSVHIVHPYEDKLLTVSAADIAKGFSSNDIGLQQFIEADPFINIDFDTRTFQSFDLF
jgi:hypothetical protein